MPISWTGDERGKEGDKAFGLRHWASRGARYTAWEAEGGQATGDRGLFVRSSGESTEVSPTRAGLSEIAHGWGWAVGGEGQGVSR